MYARLAPILLGPDKSGVYVTWAAGDSSGFRSRLGAWSYVLLAVPVLATRLLSPCRVWGRSVTLTVLPVCGAARMVGLGQPTLGA